MQFVPSSTQLTATLTRVRSIDALDDALRAGLRSIGTTPELDFVAPGQARLSVMISGDQAATLAAVATTLAPFDISISAVSVQTFYSVAG